MSRKAFSLSEAQSLMPFDSMTVPGPRVFCAKPSKSVFARFHIPSEDEIPVHNWSLPGNLRTASIALQICIQGEYSGRYLQN